MTSRCQKLVLAVLASLAVGTTAFASTPDAAPLPSEQFAVLQGVDALPLSAAEMDAIHGALTGQEVFDRLLASANLIRDPALRARTVAYLTANQTQLVAFFDRILAFFRR